MAYHQGSSDLRNRQNILQDLQQQKQHLLNQVGTGAGVTPVSNIQQLSSRNSKVELNMLQIPMTRRTALEFASAYSSGYFISQDSQYGNLILPVIPRMEDS